jgi:hypothetical protein
MGDSKVGKPAWTLALLMAGVACGGGVPPVSFSAPLRAESMECAEDRLRAADYDVGWDGDVLEGEVRIMAGEIATRREFIQVSEISPNELEARVIAYRLDPVANATVTRPNTAVPTDPSASTLSTAESLVEACGG